jgi:transposase InsO family protein
LQRYTGGVGQRRHDGKIAVERSNLRWCSDGFELACENGEKVRVAFALDCCDREAMAYVATTHGIKGEDVRDLMVASIESRFGKVNRSLRTIEWLSDNGSGRLPSIFGIAGPSPKWVQFRLSHVGLTLGRLPLNGLGVIATMLRASCDRETVCDKNP